MLRSHSDTSDDMGSQEETAEVFLSPRGRRSYDCVFCKRGFSTAQALGGHMNIHRRDRAKISGKREGYCAGRNGIHSERCHGCYCPYSRSTASLAREPRVDVAAQRLCELRFFGEDLNLGPKVHGNCRGEDRGEKDGEDGGLDLELRLG